MKLLSAKNDQLYQELTVQSTAPETIQVKYATKRSHTEEEMQEKAITVVEETRKWDIKELKD